MTNQLLYKPLSYSARFINKLPLGKTLINKYRLHNAQVFLISYPKCGRTWLRLMLGKIFIKQFGIKNINPLDIGYMGYVSPQIPTISVIHDDNPHHKTPKQQTTNKSFYKSKKVIFLIRDPRDVFVSTYFQLTKREFTFDGTIDEFLTHPVGSIDSIIRFYNLWSQNIDTPKEFLLVKYQDLHTQPEKQLTKILTFLGINTVDPKIIKQAVKYASFDNMKKMETSNQLNHKILQPTKAKDKESFKTRKGKIGGYKNYLNQKQIKYLDKKINQELSDFYHFYKTH